MNQSFIKCNIVAFDKTQWVSTDLKYLLMEPYGS